MDPNFDYNSLPYYFEHCINAECKRADQCLRRQMALRMPVERKIVTIINPASIAASGEGCPYFKVDQTVAFAQGITHLLDHLPHNKSVAIKQQLLQHFGRSLYYRFWRKEYMISPAQQKEIRLIFRKNGIQEDPLFDEFVDHYE